MIKDVTSALRRSLAVMAFAALPLAAQAQAGVSVSIGQPGFYGTIDLGDLPRPRLVLPQPVIIAPGAVVAAPAYLRVPPGHRKKWAKHCHRYDACGRPVYFVQDGWYRDVYAPAYRARHGDTRHEDRHDHDEDHDRGHGKRHGKGHGRHGKD